VRMQPGVELSVGKRQWLVINNVFGYLAKGQGHRGEHQDAGHQVQTQKTLCGKLRHECRTETSICRINFEITSRGKIFRLPFEISHLSLTTAGSFEWQMVSVK
jgi:hypothetical protein